MDLDVLVSYFFLPAFSWLTVVIVSAWTWLHGVMWRWSWCAGLVLPWA